MARVNGQGKLAEQAIATLMQRDPIFLQSLVAPYINGIVIHAIERARKSTGVKEPGPEISLPKKTVFTKKPLPAQAAPSGNAMDNLMKAWAKGFEQNGAPAPATDKVSSKHMEAMQALIKKKTF